MPVPSMRHSRGGGVAGGGDGGGGELGGELGGEPGGELGGVFGGEHGAGGGDSMGQLDSRYSGGPGLNSNLHAMLTPKSSWALWPERWSPLGGGGLVGGGRRGGGGAGGDAGGGDMGGLGGTTSVLQVTWSLLG